MATGYLRKQTNRNAPAQVMAAESKRPAMSLQETEWHIEAIITKIQAGHYKTYAKGGYSRSAGRFMTPAQVAERCAVDGPTCLHEIKDGRIERAVLNAGLTIVTASTHRSAMNSVRVWRQSIAY